MVCSSGHVLQCTEIAYVEMEMAKPQQTMKIYAARPGNHVDVWSQTGCSAANVKQDPFVRNVRILV
jgi:hypothetical protein